MVSGKTEWNTLELKKREKVLIMRVIFSENMGDVGFPTEDYERIAVDFKDGFMEISGYRKVKQCTQ